jgi:HEPN domain-containing protein
MPDYEDMMYDAMMDAKHAAEYEHWYDEIVEDFKADNLTAFYDKNPKLLQKSFVAINEAKKVIDTSPSAALLFAFTAIETAIKYTLIQPIIYGITDNEKIANLISNNFLKTSNANTYINMAFNLTKEVIDLDLSDTKSKYGKPLISEIKIIATKRNKIIHSAELCTKQEAELALKIVDDIFKEIIEITLSKMHFTIRDKEICRIYSNSSR